jgi:hypothetical protein
VLREREERRERRLARHRSESTRELALEARDRDARDGALGDADAQRLRHVDARVGRALREQHRDHGARGGALADLERERVDAPRYRSPYRETREPERRLGERCLAGGERGAGGVAPRERLAVRALRRIETRLRRGVAARECARAIQLETRGAKRALRAVDLRLRLIARGRERVDLCARARVVDPEHEVARRDDASLGDGDLDDRVVRLRHDLDPIALERADHGDVRGVGAAGE